MSLALFISACGQPTTGDENISSITRVDASPHFNVTAIAAMKKQLLAEPKIVDVMYDPAPMSVAWQIGVKTDGSSRIGYADYVCELLNEKGLVDKDTDVRIVDVVKLQATNGDFRAASLGHRDCTTRADLGA